VAKILIGLEVLPTPIAGIVSMLKVALFLGYTSSRVLMGGSYISSGAPSRLVSVILQFI